MSTCLRFCTSASCSSRGSETLRQRCEAVAKAADADLIVKGVGCHGPCSDGPLFSVSHHGSDQERLFALESVTGDDFAADLGVAIAGGTLQQWCPKGCRELDPSEPFLALQRRIVLERCGRVDPENLKEAEAAGAYQPLQTVLATADRQQLIDLVRRSGLRGRGGAGYPTGLKWAAVAAMEGEQKCVVCNADEGDPGAFMDRTLLEGDPHGVLEGMAIAAYAVGAQRGYIYIRAEYPLAIQRLRRAIDEAREHQWLGHAIAGSSFSFDLELRVGAGAYVCGEETALIHSIEGHRGVPRPRPPYPSEQGVFGRPTLINNVETFANIPVLLRLGLERYGIGTKVFSLTGHVKRSGVIEVPIGTPLRTIVETMAGGPSCSAPIKAVQTGGPSGGCIPAAHLDTPVDYDSLQALGTIMGSGGMVVMDQTTNMVDVAAFFMAFSRDESCGKCIPCRTGTVQLELLLRKLLSGAGGPADLEQLERLCGVVKDASLCGLGQSAPKPVLSTLRHFRDDYLSLLEGA